MNKYVLSFSLMAITLSTHANFDIIAFKRSIEHSQPNIRYTKKEGEYEWYIATLSLPGSFTQTLVCVCKSGTFYGQFTVARTIAIINEDSVNVYNQHKSQPLNEWEAEVCFKLLKEESYMQNLLRVPMQAAIDT